MQGMYNNPTIRMGGMMMASNVPGAPPFIVAQQQQQQQQQYGLQHINHLPAQIPIQQAHIAQQQMQYLSQPMPQQPQQPLPQMQRRQNIAQAVRVYNQGVQQSQQQMTLGTMLQAKMTEYIDPRKLNQILEETLKQFEKKIPDRYHRKFNALITDSFENIKIIIKRKLSYVFLIILEEAIKNKKIRTMAHYNSQECEEIQFQPVPNDNIQMIKDYNANFIKQEETSGKETGRYDKIPQRKDITGSYGLGVGNKGEKPYSAFLVDLSMKNGIDDKMERSLGNYCVLYYFRDINKKFPQISSVSEFKELLDKAVLQIKDIDEMISQDPNSKENIYRTALNGFIENIEKKINKNTPYVNPVFAIDIIHALNSHPSYIPKKYLKYLFRTDLSFKPKTVIVNSIDGLNGCIFDYSDIQELRTIISYWKSGM